MTDSGQEYKIDKIVFHYQEFQKLQNQLNQTNTILVSGLFGSQNEIEKQLFDQIHIKAEFPKFLNDSNKGSLIGIRFQNKIIFCLLLPQELFQSKPIKEKAIELTLFRILQDLTDNIQICLDNEIYDSWYRGDEVPFSPFIIQRQQYNYVEQGDQEIQEYQCQPNIFCQDITQYQVLLSQNLSPFFTIIQKLQFNEQEFKNNYENFLKKIIYQNIQNDQLFTPQFQLIEKQYQSKSFKSYLQTIADEIKTLIASEKKNLPTSKQRDNQSLMKFFGKSKKQYFPQSSENNDLYLIESFKSKIDKIKSDKKKQLDQILKDLKKTTKYSINKLNCKVRSSDKNKIETIWFQIEQNQQVIFDLNLENIKIKEVFQTKDKAEILLIETKYNFQLYFRQQNSEQFQLMQIYELQKTKNLVCFFKISHTHLYFFNFNDKQVLKISVSPFGKIDEQLSICEQCVKLEDTFVDITIKQVAYMSQQKKFILLTQKKDVYFFLEDSKQIIQAMCSSKDNKKQHLQLTHKNISEQNEQLLSCPSGKYFYFSDGEQCSMYDLNGLQIRKIKIQGIIKIFQDQGDILIMDNIEKIEQNNRIIVLANAIKQKTINKLGDEEKQILGNPSLDIIKGSSIKFGPNSVFLSQSKKKLISFQIDQEKFNLIETYLNKINLNNINLDIQKLQFAEINQQDLQSIIFSRVPLQLCTTENGILIPLHDGFRKETSNQQKVCVYEKSKQLRLGFIEEFLINNKSPIFVIGIIGKQSSGKSYLLNRVFGTRFSVSSARCTDGIWASIGLIDGQKFLILDCEGLFNSARTNQEEVQMLAFLTAICDISILNSDITFNRYMNDLFNNLTNASSQLKGETLFKGQLHIALRDVSSTDNSGIDNELLSNLYRLKSQESQDIVFLKKLFNNNFTVEKLFNFEHQQFDAQIVNLRSYFSKMAQSSKRWEEGKKLLQMIKILLCQLELSDNGNAYLIDLKLQVEQIFENQNQLWHEFLINEPSTCKLDQKEYQFPQNQDEIIFFNSSLLKQLQKDLQLNNTIMNHNENLNLMEIEIQKLMISRKEYILEFTKQELQRYQQPEIIEIKSKAEGLLTIYINNQIQQYQFCKEKCQHCYLNCTQFKSHIKEYDKLMNTFQDQKEALEKEITESSIKTDDEEQKIQQRLIEISEELKMLDINISLQEQLKQKAETCRKLLKYKKGLSKFQFCDTENKKLKLQILGLTEFQNEYQYVNLTAENLDKIIIQITIIQDEKNQLLENNLKIINDFENKTRQKEQQIMDIKNEIKISQGNHLKYSQQKDELFQRMSHLQNELNIIKLEQQRQESNLLQQINCKIDNNNIIKQQEKIQAKILEEQNKYLLIKNQITILDQRMYDFSQQKLTFYQEVDLIDEYKEIKKEKDMLLYDIDKLQKQLDKIDKLQSMYQLLPNLTVIQNKEKLKYENELKIKTELDLNMKQKEIEQTIIIYQQQLKKQKFDDIEILDQIYNENKQTSKGQELEKIVYQNFVDHKKSEKLDLKEQLENQTENIQKIEKTMNNMKIAYEILSNYQKQQDQQQKVNNSMNQNKDQLIKINEYTKQIEQQIDELKSQLQQQINQFELEKINNSKIIEINNQIEQALQNINKQQPLLSECLKIVYNIEDYPEYLDISKKELEDLVNDKGYDQKYLLLLEEKEKLQNEKEKLDQIVQKYSQVGEEKQQLEKLTNKINKLNNLNSNIHSCQRESHICDQQCSQCKDKQCNKKAGHDEKQEHICSKQDHICEQHCSVEQCKNICKNIRDHKGNHTCNEKHICENTCNYCDKQCQFDRTDIHQIHICLDKNNGCNQECELCEKNCQEQHEHSIKRESYCQKRCSLKHLHQRQPPGTHLCNEIHFCKEICSNEGICNVEYESVQVTWKTNISEFQYTKYIPKNGGKKKCMHQIPKGKCEHDQDHVCMRDTDVQYHYCDQKCPECQSFCELQYGHSGLHYSSKHRNKDYQKFTKQKGKNSQIKVLSEDGKVVKNYVVGEASSPETCGESCKRRGRSHFHLIECQGGLKCLEKTHQRYAKHSKNIYQGFEDIKFDEILCFQFWELKIWTHPLQNTEDIDIIQACDAYCPQCSDIKMYCEERGWHTNSKKIQDHKLPCAVNHKQDLIHGIDVAFVIDTTGSMSLYITSCIEIIKKTMQKFSEQKNLINQCQFAIVSYKDHNVPYDINQQVVEVQDFASEDVIRQFLGSLNAQGGGDYAEALLDGLNASINLSWNDKNVKILYLIADAPPHGNNILKKIYYHNSTDDYPDGCPCGLEQTKILQTIQEKNIQLKVLKLNQSLEMMISHFKVDYSKLIELTPLNIEQNEFKNIMINDICKYLEHNEITYQFKY